MNSLNKDRLSRLEEFLKPPWIGVMATIGQGGVPHLTPIWYNYSDGWITISSRKASVKSKNLVRDNRLALTICSEPQAVDYVTIWGEAEIRDDDSIWGPTQAIMERYLQSDKVGPFMANIKEAGDRSIISFKPKRIRFRTEFSKNL